MDVATAHMYTVVSGPTLLCCLQISDSSLCSRREESAALDDTLLGGKWVNKTWERGGKYADYLLSWSEATQHTSHILSRSFTISNASCLDDRQPSRPLMLRYASGYPLICMRLHHCFLHYIPFSCGERRYELWEIKIPTPAAKYIIKRARFNKQTAAKS